MTDILLTIMLFVGLFAIGSLLFVIAFCLYTWAYNREEEKMFNEKERWK